MAKPPVISQNIYSKGRGVKKVVFQQLKNPADFELNELQDTLLEFQTDTRHFLGGYGFLGDGQLVEATGNPSEFSVRAGIFSTGDKIVVVSEDVVVDALPTPTATLDEYVYVVVGEEYLDSVDVPSLRDPLTGEEKALRLAYSVTFGLTDGGVFPSISADESVVVFAKVRRTIGVDAVSAGDITDMRAEASLNFCDSVGPDAYKITSTLSTTITIEGGVARIFGNLYTSVGGNRTLTAGALNFVYLNAFGGIVASTTRPTGIHLELYRISVSALAVISNIEDRRRWAPGGLAGISFNEILQARGSMSSLDERLSASLEDDGTVKVGVVPIESMSPLVPTATVPPTLTIAVAEGSMESGSETVTFPGGISPSIAIPASDSRIDLVYLTTSGTLAVVTGSEAPSPTPPSHFGLMPIAEITISSAHSVITQDMIRDVRPFLLIDLNTADNAVGAKLLEVKNHSSMEDAILESLASDANVDGTSTGTYIGASDFELAVGETFVSAFATPGTAPSPTPEVIPSVIFRQDVVLGDYSVEVNRGGGWEIARHNSVHTFTGGGTNDLQIRVTNTGASTVNVAGVALLFNPLSSPEVTGAESGLIPSVGGLKLHNTDMSPVSYFAENFAFTWDSATAGGTLSWGAALTGTADALQVEYIDPVAGTVINSLASPGSLAGINAGYYVYMDLDRAGAGAVTLQVSATKPEALRDRVILGRRMPAQSAANDVFVLASGLILPDVTNMAPYSAAIRFPPVGLSPDVAERVLNGDSILGIGAVQALVAPTITSYTLDANTRFINLEAGIAWVGGNSASGSWIIDTSTGLMYGWQQQGASYTYAYNGIVPTAQALTTTTGFANSLWVASYSFTPGVGGSIGFYYTIGGGGPSAAVKITEFGR